MSKRPHVGVLAIGVIAPVVLVVAARTPAGAPATVEVAAFALFAAAALVVMAAPGVGALGLALRRLPELAEYRTLLVATVVVAAAVQWWITFWLWSIAPAAGRVVAVLVYGVGVLAAASRGPLLRRLGRPALALLALPLAATLVANGVVFMRGGVEIPLAAAQSVYGMADNWFPHEWVDRVLDGRDLQVDVLGGWPIVDRPPVQAAFTLPVAAVSGDTQLASHLGGSLLQGLGVLAGIVSLAVAGARRQRLVVAGLLVTLTAFVTFGTAYVWPKLFASGLVLLAAAVFVEIGRSEPVWRRQRPDVGDSAHRLRPAPPPASTGPAWAAVLALLAISVIAHPVGLLGLPLVIIAGLRHPLPLPPRQWWVPLAVVPGVFATSWLFYRGVVDPASSRMAQWHLAGADRTASDGSLVAVILDRYREIGVAGAVRQRLENLELFGGVGYVRWLGDGGLETSFGTIVRRSFRVPLLTPGVLLLAVPLVWWWRRLATAAVTLLVGGAVSLALWLAVMFGPPLATAVTTHAPYAAVLAVTVGLALVVVTLLPRWAGIVAVVVQGSLWFVSAFHRASEGLCAQSGMCVPFELSGGGGPGAAVSVPALAMSAVGVGLLVLALIAVGARTTADAAGASVRSEATPGPAGGR